MKMLREGGAMGPWGHGAMGPWGHGTMGHGEDMAMQCHACPDS